MAGEEELFELLLDGSRYGDADDVHKALEAKVDVNKADEWGKTGAGSVPEPVGQQMRPGDGPMHVCIRRHCRPPPLAAARLHIH
jgi:hypothetical protein